MLKHPSVTLVYFHFLSILRAAFLRGGQQNWALLHLHWFKSSVAFEVALENEA